MVFKKIGALWATSFTEKVANLFCDRSAFLPNKITKKKTYYFLALWICSLFSFRQVNGLPVKKRISVELCDPKHSFRCSLNFSFIRYRLSYGETVAELTFRCKCVSISHHNLPVYAFRQSELMTLEVMVCVSCLRRWDDFLVVGTLCKLLALLATLC